jgi:putative ABC transport system permease protein
MNSQQPDLPEIVIRFLKFICPNHLFEEIEGDIIQRYVRDVKRYGEAKARRKMIWNSIRFVRPGIILRNKISLFNPFHMTLHFLKVMIRVTAKNKVTSFINVTGLVLGMTAFTLISLYVMTERSYDTFQTKSDRIFRVRQDRYTGSDISRQWTAGPWGIGNALKANFPEVVRYVNVNRGGVRSTVLSNGSTFFKEERVYYASEGFFELFSYKLIKGIDSLVLKRPFTMVVSESLAKRYFGNEDPIGKTLRNNGREDYEITGVFEDVPENTHLKFDALLSFESLTRILGPEETQDLMDNWGWAGNYTYIELEPSTDVKSFEAKIPPLVDKKMGAYLREWGEQMKFVLQPVPSIHLNSNFKDELEPNGDSRSVGFLQVVAVFILLMAWINYVNLSTARSIERSKEVGIRKVLGSYRLTLIKQFLLEAMVLKGSAAVITILIVAILLPDFSSFVARRIELPAITPNIWIPFAGVFFSSVLIASIYPALVLSGFKPVSILKGTTFGSIKGNYLRRGLVTVQFVSSVVMIAGTFTVYQQVKFMRGGDLGLRTDQVLVVQGPHIVDSTFHIKYDNFRSSLLQFSEVQNVTVSTDIPGRSVKASNGGVRIEGEEPKQGHAFRVIMSDEDFTDTYGMALLEGRTFSRAFNEPWKTCLVNETAMKLLGFNDPQKIIGRRIYVWGSTLEIIGVIKDFHQESLKKKMDQLIFVCDKDIRDYISIRLVAGESPTELIRRVEAKFSTVFPGNPFTYFFADEYYDQQYKSDRQFVKVFSLFTVLAVTISCLGLFGLSSYMAHRRIKEVSIRKVLGASVNQIALMVSREFVLLVFIANIIAIPLTYLIMEGWLNGFAYRINVGIMAFLFPGACMVVVTLITVSFQAIKVAFVNPVESLKTE